MDARGAVWVAAQNGVVALIAMADGSRSRERRTSGYVYITLAGKGLTPKPLPFFSAISRVCRRWLLQPLRRLPMQPRDVGSR